MIRCARTPEHDHCARSGALAQISVHCTRRTENRSHCSIDFWARSVKIENWDRTKKVSYIILCSPRKWMNTVTNYDLSFLEKKFRYNRNDYCDWSGRSVHKSTEFHCWEWSSPIATIYLSSSAILIHPLLWGASMSEARVIKLMCDSVCSVGNLVILNLLLSAKNMLKRRSGRQAGRSQDSGHLNAEQKRIGNSIIRPCMTQ